MWSERKCFATPRFCRIVAVLGFLECRSDNFNAIIGSDLLNFLKTLVINWNHGRISSQDPFMPTDTFYQVRKYHLIADATSREKYQCHHLPSLPRHHLYSSLPKFIPVDFRSPTQSQQSSPPCEFGTPEIWQHVRQMHNL